MGCMCACVVQTCVRVCPGKEGSGHFLMSKVNVLLYIILLVARSNNDTRVPFDNKPWTPIRSSLVLS